ncbi:MAG: PhoH family protein, partial [Ignavibacteriae bacterium]|nr:PhoH family protein [Ignavibacteriota bacterium]
MSRKNFVLDTNVLLHDPYAMFNFEDNHVLIPIYVIEEIDSFKKEMSERGRNSREVARILDRFRHQGRLSDGVPTEKGGVLRVVIGQGTMPQVLRKSHVADNY